MAQAEQQPERYTGETLPAWSLPAAAAETIGIGAEWPERVTRDWALGGSTGAGIRVCILDSGVQADHPLVGSLEGAVALRKTEDGEIVVEEDTEGDLCGHGTACAGIVRSLAPDCRLFSVRVLGAGFKGSGSVDRKSTRLNSSHSQISYAVFCLKKKKKDHNLCIMASASLQSGRRDTPPERTSTHV